MERICGIDLTKVVGLNVLNVLLIVSEIGVDMSKWRSAKAFCSWLGLCPGNKISGGKVLDSRTRQVVNRVADALRLAAQSVGVPRPVWASSTGANKPTLERLRRPRPQRVNWLASSTTCLNTSSPTKNLTRQLPTTTPKIRPQ